MPKKFTQEEFIRRAKEIHGDKYDYSKVEYINANTKICIICHKKNVLGKEHGEFWIMPSEHLNAKRGCSKCKGFHITTEEFIEKAKRIHGDKYDYSKVEYRGSHNYVTIICHKHGPFKQIAKEHLKYGCKQCAQEEINKKLTKNKLTTEEFIRRAREVYGDKYDYSKADYAGYDTPICIICPEHGEFWQTPHTHLDEHICPFCASEKNINENKLLNLLKAHFKNENIIYQKRFKWLRNKKPMSLDIFFEERKIGIEYQGRQHFSTVGFFGGEDMLCKTKERDLLKIDLCNKNGIKILHFSFNTKDIPSDFRNYKVITNFNELVNTIENEKYSNY